jgi:hypothetical protein
MGGKERREVDGKKDCGADKGGQKTVSEERTLTLAIDWRAGFLFLIATTAYVDMDPMSDAMVSQISQWISHCDKDHEDFHCIPSDPHLPLRVIDVGSFDGSRAPFLSIGKGRKGTYVTLSYRWGSVKHYRLTLDSLEGMTRKIPLHDLPKL